MEELIAPSKKIYTAILFQLGWWLNIGGAYYNYSFLSAVISFLFILFYLSYLSPKAKLDFILILIVGLYGFVSDSILNYCDVISFIPEQDLIPIWLLAIWSLFAMTIGLYEYLDKRRGLAFILGAVFGPISYAAGLKFNLIGFSDFNISMGILALFWGLNFTGLLFLRDFIYSFSVEVSSKN